MARTSLALTRLYLATSILPCVWRFPYTCAVVFTIRFCCGFQNAYSQCKEKLRFDFWLLPTIVWELVSWTLYTSSHTKNERGTTKQKWPHPRVYIHTIAVRSTCDATTLLCCRPDLDEPCPFESFPIWLVLQGERYALTQGQPKKTPLLDAHTSKTDARGNEIGWPHELVYIELDRYTYVS